MSRTIRLPSVLAAALLFLGCDYVDTKEVATPRVPQARAAAGGAGMVSFAQDILPILTGHCGECHNDTARTAGLSLTSYAGITAAAGVVVPGDPDGSMLIQMIQDGMMPPGGRTPPTADELAALRAWILQGAPNN